MDSKPQTLPAVIQPEMSESPVAIVCPPRQVTMFRVFEMELDQLGSAHNSLMFGFFGVAFGAALATGITLTTVSFTSPFIFAGYLATFILSVFLSVVFAAMGYKDWRKGRQQVEKIKERIEPGTTRADMAWLFESRATGSRK